jgi:hypothetical protein
MGRRLDPVSASLANALMIRCVDYHDIDWKQDRSHPSDIFPAAIAGCECAVHRDSGTRPCDFGAHHHWQCRADDLPSRIRVGGKVRMQIREHCEKPNVLRETSGMMEDGAKAVSRGDPGIALWSANNDVQTSG